MNDQPGYILSTNLPWLLNDENSLEDESESETRHAGQTLVIGGRHAYSLIPRRHAPRQLMRLDRQDTQSQSR